MSPWDDPGVIADATKLCERIRDRQVDSRSGPVQVSQVLARLQPEVLEAVDAFSRSPVAEGLDAEQLAAEAAVALARPSQAIFQGDQYTCGATALEYWLAREQPLAFVETARALASPVGEAVLPSGFPIQRDESSLEQDTSGRNGLDRLMQSALMAAARIVEGSGAGLSGLQMAVLTGLVQGQDHALAVADEETAPRLLQTMEQAPDSSRFPVGLDWNGTDHVVLVEDVKAGQVEFFNSQGPALQTMAVAEFQQRLAFALIPDPLLAPLLATMPAEMLARVPINAQLKGE